MRVLFASTAGAGHLGPLLPLARACRDVGHEVHVAVPERARGGVEAAGLDARLYPDLDAGLRSDLDQTMRSGVGRDEANALMCRELFGRINTTWTLPFMRAIVDELAPEVIVREPFEPASWLAADAAGVPTVLVPCTTWRSMPLASTLLRAGLGELAESLGVGLPEGDATQNARFVASATPASIEEADGAPLDAVRLAPVTSRSEGSDRRRVFVTFGTVAGHFPGMLARIGGAVVEALRELGQPALFALGRGVDPSALGTLPDYVEARDHVSLPEVLATSSLMVCHGGYGTSMAALEAGVPVLGLPLFAYDQWDTTAVIAEAGAGRVLDAPDQRPEAIRDALAGMLADTEPRAHALALAEEMAGHTSCEDVALHLEHYLLD